MIYHIYRVYGLNCDEIGSLGLNTLRIWFIPLARYMTKQKPIHGVGEFFIFCVVSNIRLTLEV